VAGSRRSAGQPVQGGAEGVLTDYVVEKAVGYQMAWAEGQKRKRLKINGLSLRVVPRAAAHKKNSKNEGRSDDVYQNTGSKVPIFRHPTMCMKTKIVTGVITSEPTMFMKIQVVSSNFAPPFAPAATR
jgi:hypothetical protein